MTKEEVEQIEKLGLDHPIVKCVTRLNREMGEVRGELKWIKVVTAGTFGAVLVQLVSTIL